MAASPGSSRRGPAERTVITDALTGRSRELRTREKRYAITMAFRTACFVAMIFVPGNFRWVLFAGAVFLPYVAVVLANQAHDRGTSAPFEPGMASDAPMLTATVEPNLSSGDVISGDVIDDDAGGGPRQSRQDRVA